MKQYYIIASVRASDHLTATIASINESAGFAGEHVTIVVAGGVLSTELRGIALGKYVELRVANDYRDRGMLAKFNTGLESLKGETTDDAVVFFCNDDIIMDRFFVNNLSISDFTAPVLLGPIVRTPDGSLQRSMFRKRYGKMDMFFRVWDGGLYTKLFGRWVLARCRLDADLNKGRLTVDGCCFGLNGAALAQMVRFDDRIYLYYEEVFLQNCASIWRWHCSVREDLAIVHLGGASESHGWSARRSSIQMKSALYVARSYLNFGALGVGLLGVYRWFEGGLRKIAGPLKHKRIVP